MALAATVVLVLAVGAGLLVSNPPEVVESGTSFKAAEFVDVVQLQITNSHGSMSVNLVGEGYSVDDLPAGLVDLAELVDLLTHSSNVYAERTATSAPDDAGTDHRLALYGLAEPAARVEIAYADGGALTLLIGDVEQVTGDTYFAIEGDPAVYLMPSERCAGFLLPKEAFIEDLVTPELALSSPLSALLDVTFSGGSLSQPVTIEAVAAEDPEVVRAALSFGAATHIVRGRGVYELDQTYAVEMLGPLLGITANDIVGYSLTQEEILAFGFDEPTMQVSFDLRNGINAEVQHFDLAVLQKDNGGAGHRATYLTCNDNGVIYAIPEPAFLDLEYSKLLVRWFLSPLLIDVSEVELTTAGEPYHFVVTGEASAELAVTLNGQTYDIERFRDLFRLLTSAAHDGRLLTDTVVEGVPLLQVTYHYEDGQKAPDVMALYPGDTRRFFVEVNGVTELAIRETYLFRVQEAVANLWTDEPIETEW